MNEETKKPEEDRAEEETKEQKPAPEKVAPEEKKETAGQPKKKKVNRLTLKELEKKIQQVQEKMGSLHSAYAQQLLKRKEQLLQKTEDREQKTEDKESDI